MKKNEKTKTVLVTGIIAIFLLVVGLTTRDFDYAKKTYQIYLNGNKLGLIESKEELYDLINEEQKAIKEAYNVDNVFPPNGFVIKEYNTYDKNITTAKNIYETIKDKDDFTVKGYTVKIKFSEDREMQDQIIHVLDENIFKEALKSVVTAFIDVNDFNAYIYNTQESIDETGKIIEDLYFEETITIKPSYISVNEKIYTDATELTQFLLFGAGTNEKNYYTVKRGDTIATVSLENKLNPQEFLIANPKYKSENSILAVGDTVDVTLINPILTLVESIYSVSDEEQEIEKENQYDATKPYSFSEIIQTGISKIDRVSRKSKVINGEPSQGVETVNTITIRESQPEITMKGGNKPIITGTYVDNGRMWGWPTNRPYQITSGFEWRWGSFHNALDISGTGEGSPIYATRDGVVVETERNCPNYGSYRNTCGGTYGNHVVLDHKDNYYTMYAHMLQNVAVQDGQTVKRGQIVGYMGSSGSSTGIHLHYGISIGMPNQGGYWKNPMQFYR